MQYQIFKRNTNEVVAWIDTETGEHLVHKDYDIKEGNNLISIAEEVEDSRMKIRCKFFDKTVYPEGLLKIGGKKSNWIDLRAREDIVLEKGVHKLIPLGVAIQLPEGYEAIIAPRSSTFKNFFILQTNSIGVVDESFCGDNDEWKLPVIAIHDTEIKKGERICQFRIIEHQPEFDIEVVDALNNADRGGIGSTGTE